MSEEGSRCLYATQEVPFVQTPDGVTKWELASGRRFLWDDGVVFVYDGIVYIPLAKTPDWAAGMQFSLGFDAGRTIAPLWQEFPRRR